MEQEDKEIKKFNIKIGDIIFDHYKVLKQIGKGGMDSIIYLVEDTTAQKNSFSLNYYALKIINRAKDTTDESWARYYDECITCTRISQCENVVKTYYIKEIVKDKTIAILMEYVSGNSLREVIEKEGLLSVQEVLFLFKKILLALKDLHSFSGKIIHRDLKPENILLSRDRSNLKIIDFGISSVVYSQISKDEAKENNKFATNEKVLYGTYPYISPDLYNAYRPSSTVEQKFKVINEQCDFYSIGIILYEMLTGNKPFIGDPNEQSIITLPLKYDLPPLSKNNPKIPLALENVIFRCIASKKEDLCFRYSNVLEIIHDIDDIIKYPEKARTAQLIKPYSKRTLQASFFDIEREKSKLKPYNLPWFYWLFTFLVVALVMSAIILIIFIKK
ncbi:MAG: serine/threonine protein kinase [Mycoplasma sp.]|nr:serine/threonine protein kinase [Mycoplasma sp.]